MPTEEVICGALSLSCSIGRTGPRAVTGAGPAPSVAIVRYDPADRELSWPRREVVSAIQPDFVADVVAGSAATRMTDVK